MHIEFFIIIESDISECLGFLKERISQKESFVFIAKDESEKLVGFVQLYPLFSSTRMKRLWLLNDLFVDPKYRGLGISKSLIEMAKSWCKSTNGCALILETEKSNLIVNQLYPSVGFSLDEEHNYYSWDV